MIIRWSEEQSLGFFIWQPSSFELMFSITLSFQGWMKQHLSDLLLNKYYIETNLSQFFVWYLDFLQSFDLNKNREIVSRICQKFNLSNSFMKHIAIQKHDCWEFYAPKYHFIYSHIAVEKRITDFTKDLQTCSAKSVSPQDSESKYKDIPEESKRFWQLYPREIMTKYTFISKVIDSLLHSLNLTSWTHFQWNFLFHFCHFVHIYSWKHIKRIFFQHKRSEVCI